MTEKEKQQHWVRWVILLIAVSVTILELLDTTIVVVSLPYMRGDFSASTNEISWVMAAYLLGLAIIVPLTGFLTKRLGNKRLLLIAIAGFCVTSFLCSIASNLNEIVFYSLLQGMFGALLAPLGQSLVVEYFHQKELSTAMSLYGVGVMGAPILGPILGGVLTEYLNWRWDYIINIPICLMSIALVYFFVERKSINNNEENKIDWTGMTLLIIGVSSLQFVLSQGAEKSWFDSNLILALTLLSIVTLLLFLIRGLLVKEKNIINFAIYKDRNFTVGSVMILFFRLTLISVLTWIPNYLQEYLNFSPLQAGLAVVPFGVANIFSLLITPYLMRFISPRYLVALGFFIFALCAWHLSHLTLHVSQSFFQLTFVGIGFSAGFFFVPTMRSAYTTLPKHFNHEASGLFNFSRAIAGSFGVSITATIITMQTQVNWHRLGGNISVYHSNFISWLSQRQMSLSDAKIPLVLASHLAKTAGSIAYADSFHFGMILCMITLPLAFLFRRPAK